MAAGPINYLDEVEADHGTGGNHQGPIVADITLDAVNTDTFDVAFADAESGVIGSLGADIGDDDEQPTAAIPFLPMAKAAPVKKSRATRSPTKALSRWPRQRDGHQVEVISDPVNLTTNPKAIPGATIQYCIAVSNATGSADATDIVVTDDLPFDVTFLSGFGIFVNGTATIDSSSGTPVATCNTDGSAGGSYTAGSGDAGENQVTGSLSDITAGQTRSLYFRVTIN